ncbi:MaoC family dehydratase N-terminal domain-containing protein [Nocardia sp. NPDC050710]|uniref:FAS1-like dehydratase domain-containing protein n=1 Tax=Nocardia sp. NPDC050710 TaxID=3157220 RepID=UPI0033DE7E4C
MRESATEIAVARSPVDHFSVTMSPDPIRGEAIREFAHAVRDFHPAYRDATRTGLPALVAPATFGATILTGVQRDILGSLIPDGSPDRILHVDQVLDLRRPLVEGDQLICRAHVESLRYFADYHVLTIRAALIDQQGAIAQTATTSLLTRIGGEHCRAVVHEHATARGAAYADSISGPRPRMLSRAIDIDELTVGFELPPWTVELRGGDLVRYAELTGTADPPLVADGPYGSAGADPVLTPSTFELGLAATFLTSRLGVRTVLTRLRTQSARHTHYLTLSSLDFAVVELRGHVTALDTPHRRVTVAMTAHANGRALFSYATAELQIPQSS